MSSTLFPPNNDIKKKYHFEHEGSVKYSFSMNNKIREGIMFGYVTGGTGHTAVMVRAENGKINVEEKF